MTRLRILTPVRRAVEDTDWDIRLIRWMDRRGNWIVLWLSLACAAWILPA